MTSHGEELCPACNERFTTGDEATRCRACKAFYHLECVGVTECDPKFGCGNCYEIPGDMPRRKFRPLPAAGAQPPDDGEETSQVDEQDVQGGARPDTDQDKQAKNRSLDPPAAPQSRNRRTSVDSASSRHSERQDQMMVLLKTQSEMMVQQTKLLTDLVQSRGSIRSKSDTSEKMERAGQWIRQSTGFQRQVNKAPPPNGAASQPEVNRRRDTTFALSSTRRDDLALNVTRCTNTAEFLDCLDEAKRGMPGINHSPSYNKQPTALRPFSGGELPWLDFIANYLESTAEYRVSDLKNAERCRAALTGKPLEILDKTMILTSSLSDALDILRITYGNPLKVIAALEKEVMQADRVGEQGENLQSFLLTTKRFVNYVEACGHADQLSSRTLLSRLQEKLPFFLAMRWGDQLREQKVLPSLKEFSAYLQEQFETALLVDQDQVRLVTLKKTPAKRVLMAAVEAPKSATDEPTSVPFQPNEPPPCPMCKGEHRLKNCSMFDKAKDDDRWKVVEDQKLCWNCLRPHQQFRRCRVGEQCGVNGCKYRHDKRLHNILAKRLLPAQPNMCVAGQEDEVLFKIVPAQVHSGDASADTFCFMDEGSAVSMIDASLADELMLTGPVESLTIKWTNGKTQTDRSSRRVTLEISGADGEKYKIANVRTMRELELPEQTLEMNTIKQLFPDNDGPEPFTKARPRMLLGLRHAHLGAPREVREESDEELWAIRTKLGWIVYGSGGSNGAPGLGLRVCNVTTCKEPELESLMKAFYDLDSFGVRAAPHRLGADQQRALDVLERTTRNVGKRYETGLLWRDDAPRLPESRNMCLKRANSLRLRMFNDPELAVKLQKLIADYLQKGYCCDVTGTEPKYATWYLPVFPVVNPNKPEKVRLVFDAAAQADDGRSLNSFLLSGPDMLTPLPDVLMRFREKKVAVTADVCEMFHQIRIREQDRDAQRFFWWSPGAREPRELRLDVMTFGATSSPAAAHFVLKKNAKLYEKDHKEAVKEILTNYYVDDQLSCFHTVGEANRVMGEVIKIQENAGFELKKMRSSSREVMAVICEPQQSAKDLPGAGGSVLGMKWDCESDLLQFSVENALKLRDHDPLTRRKMLSGTMSLFDPLGIAANVVVKAKMLMKLCLKLDWDEEVSDELKERWRNWCDLLLQLKEVPVPRFLGLHQSSPWELHTFVDASEEAYAAMTYARGFTSTGEIVCSLVMAKTRVAPARATTMPRMELCAAVLGARLADTVQEATTMTISRSILWSDSMDCLCWVRSSHRKYHAFVAARIDEILNLTKEENWRWVPTKVNVADDATRFESEINHDRWLHGPDFLYQEENEWPKTPQRLGNPKEELVPTFAVRESKLGLIPDPARFSQWPRLVNATAYAFRFFCSRKGRRGGLELEPEELQQAEEELWRAAQQEEYAELVRDLKANSNYTTSKGHSLHRVCPVIDDKCILRVNGRLPAQLYPDDVRQPIILPSSSRITELFVRFMHNKYMHMNHETVVNEIRRYHYIPGLRRLVAKVAHNCPHCRVRRPRIEPPQQGPLPPARAMIGFRAFTYCGFDYFGPFEVVVGRRREKRWGALFTCLTTRAVHIEIAHSLDMESCAMCVRLMCARRDIVPIEIRSDRGTNFTATDKELQKFADRFPAIKWNFNPPAAPHMGGAWERMVRAIKRCFHEVIGVRALTDEILRCALIESEWVVNQHPLTHVQLDSDDEPALTPNDFLHGAKQRRDRREIVMGPEEPLLLKKSWRLAQQIADHFWRRFEREVVPILNMPTKWFKRGVPLAVDDAVMVSDDTHRGAWRRGRITEIFKGKRDDQVRQVRVETAQGTIMRPAVKVAKIDSS